MLVRRAKPSPLTIRHLLAGMAAVGVQLWMIRVTWQVAADPAFEVEQRGYLSNLLLGFVVVLPIAGAAAGAGIGSLWSNVWRGIAVGFCVPATLMAIIVIYMLASG